MLPSGVFVAGDGAAAKGTATGLLRDSGWDDESVVDLGGSRPRARPSTSY